MAVRYARLTASLAALTAVGIGAVEVAADLEARSELARIVAAHPDLAIKSMRVEPFGGKVVLEGVEAGRGEAGHVAIGRLTLTRASIGLGLVTSAHAESALDSAIKSLDAKPKAEPAPDAEAPAAEPEAKTPAAETPATEMPAAETPAATPAAPQPTAPAPAASVPAQPPAAIPGTATAENVVITSGSTTYRIKRIDLTGTPLSNQELASLLDLNAADPMEVRLKKLNATSIVVPEILADDPTAGSEGHAAFSQVLLSGVVAGRATAASVGGVTFEMKTGQTTTNGTVGAVQSFGVDFAQIAHVFGSVRKDDSEPVRPIYDSITVTGLKGSDGKGGGFTVALLKETDLKARPLKSDVFVAPKAGVQKRSKAEDLAIFKDFATSVEIGSLDLVDLAADGADPKGPSKFTLASAGMRGFGKGRFGGISIRGIRLDAPAAKVALGGFELGAIALAQDKSAATVPTSVKADLEQLDIDVNAGDAGAKKDPVRFKLAHVGFQGEGKAGDVPTRLSFALDNIAFDMPQDPGQAKPLVEMGYRHLDLSAALATTYDAGNQELTMRNLTLKGIDMGTLDIGLRLANVTKGIVSPDKEVQKASAMAMLVKGLTFDVVNQGLVDRGIAWKAKQDGQSVDQEKASIIEFFDKALPAQIKSANVKTIGAAIAKFVADPKKLHIGIASKGGLGAASMAMLSDPAMLVDTLEVEASAN